MDISKAQQTQCLQRPVTMLKGNLHGLLKEIRSLVSKGEQTERDCMLQTLKGQLWRNGAAFLVKVQSCSCS